MLDGVPKVFYFTDRIKIVENIKLPKNDDFSPYLIIEPNDVGTGYKQLNFDKHAFWFNVHITKDDLKKMILALNNVHTYVTSKHKDYEMYKESNFVWKTIISIALIGYFLGVFMFVYVRLYDPDNPNVNDLTKASFFFACVATVATILLTLLS